MTDRSADAAVDIEADPFATAVAEVLEHLNDEHGDTVAFVARVVGVRPDVTAATAVGADTGGFDIAVEAPGGSGVVRLAFAETVADVGALQDQLMALLTAARAQEPDGELTSLEAQFAALSSIRTFVTSVVRVEAVTPHLRQITFGGGGLETFAPLGPDTFLYVLAPPAGRSELTIDESFTWTRWGEMPEADRPVGAYYTLRRWRPDVAELDMLFVDHGDSGEASRWARRAQPGDPVALWGPREAFEPPEGTAAYLLVGDETGQPAIAAILESLPAGTPVQVVLEVADEAEQLPLAVTPDVSVAWRHRDGAAPGTTTALVDAVRELPWPDGPVYAWGGGESRAMTAVRRHVRDERGLSREAVAMVSYWRHDAHADDDHEGSV